MNANGGQGITDFLKLEWLDDRHNNFHGSYPRLGPAEKCGRAISTEVHHAEKFTTRAQPASIESNAVPDRWNSLTVYESPAFRAFIVVRQSVLFGRAQTLAISA
jgi:hypothetical protein